MSFVSVGDSIENGNKSDESDVDVKQVQDHSQSQSQTQSQSQSQESQESPILDNKMLKRKKTFILVIVAITLLLDGMLNMVILPIIPEYLKYFPSNQNNTSLNSTTTPIQNITLVQSSTYEYSRNDLAIGFLFAIKPLIQLLVNPFSGTLIDHIGYKIPMILGLCVQFSSTLTFALTNSLEFLFLARSLQGL